MGHFPSLPAQVAAELQATASKVFAKPLAELEIASFALGEALLLKPALTRAGFDPGRIRTLQLGREQALWSASSAFAMALLALEDRLGERIEIA